MKIASILFLLVFSTGVFGQVTFQIAGAPGYDISYEVETCETDYCYGKLKVTLKQKGQKAAFQTFDLETDFSADTKGKSTVRMPFNRQSVVRFLDYNFDGTPDLAIQNGREGGYSGPSYDIYLFAPAKRKFVANEKLSSLATAPYLGMFEVDRKRRVIKTEQKSGCCMHETEEYKFINGRLVKIYDRYEDAFSNPKRVEITTKRLIGGKWHTSVKYEKQRN